MPPSLKTRRRIVQSFLLTLLVIGALVVRLGFIMFVRGPELMEKGLAVRMRTIPIGAPRGEILDDHGAVLATSTTLWSIYAVPAQVVDKASVAERLAPVLRLPVDRLLARLRQRQYLVWLKRKVPRSTAEAVLRLGLPGLDVVAEAERVYPAGAMAGQVIGFAGIDGQGLDGVELAYDRLLRGKPGAISVEMDAHNGAIPRPRVLYRPPVPGDSIRLTLDLGLQKIAERAARQALLDTHALSDYVVIMDVRTGGILALAALPGYDPNHYQEAPPERRRDPVVSDDFPPGSTFKIITAAAALNEGLVTPSTPFYDPGFVLVNGVRLRCWRAGGHGSVDFARVVEGSCNVGFVQVGLSLGTDRFYRYLKAFHLLGKTGVDLPGEATSIVPPLAQVKPVDLATMAFGQTLALTPLQLLAAVAAVADGGVWHRPHVVAAVLPADGGPAETIQVPAERVIRPAAAHTLIQLLGGVVARGTGKNAQVSGYALAGKTGTAQAVINGRYVEGKYVSSFVGFGPLPHPRLAILVGINQPVGPYYGGQIAAPVFKDVMSSALAYLNIPPNLPLPPEHMVPDFSQQEVAVARTRLQKEKLKARVFGSGPRVESQFPPPGTLVREGTEVVLFTSGEAAAVVPDLIGKSVPQAVALLDRQGLRLRLSGFGTIRRQTPAPGTRLGPGATVSVEAEPNGTPG